MAFADMFAPMRNFGATAAATTQAEAARMGAEASMKRAETAESLAPWNMGATAVQGIGTLGGLTQKFMEMGQMAPQREAMTDYYKAQTDRMAGPAAKLQGAVSSLTNLRGQDRLRARKDALEGRPFAMRAAQDEYFLRAGARRVPAPGTGAFPLERYGTPTPGPWQEGLAPTAWDWSEVSPAVREFAEHMANTLPEYLALDDDAAIAEAKSIRDNIRATTAITSGEILKIAETAPGAAQKADAVNQLTNTISALTKSGVALDSPRIAPLIVDLYNTLAGTPQFNINNLPEGALKTTLQNMEKTRAASLGAGAYAPISPIEARTITSQIRGSTEGFPRGTTLESIQRVMTKKGTLTPEERDVAGLYNLKADQTKRVAAMRLLQNLGVAARGEDIPDETINVANKTLQKLMTDIPTQLAELAQAGTRTFTTEHGSSPEFNKLLANLVRARGSVLPEQADDLWRSLVNEATKQLPALKQYGGEGLLPPGKKIGTDPDTGEPIYEGVKGTQPARVTGTTPATHQAITDVLARAQDHLSKLEPDMDPFSALGWVSGAAQGASASELAAMSKLLGEIVETPKLSAGSDLASALSGSQMRDLFHVGELRGPISGHTQYRRSYAPAWSIDQSGWTDLDEGVGGAGQMTQEVLWQLLGGAATKVGAPIAAGAARIPWLQSVFRAPLLKELGFGRERYED